MADTRVQSLIEVNKKLDELKMNQIKQVETSDALRNDINDRFTDLRNMIAELRPRNFDSQKKPMVQIPAPSTIIRTHPRSPQPPDPPDFNQFGQRFSKYEFPKFDGTSLREWLRRCDEYFCLHRTPPEMKVRVASPHMIGKALQWHTNYIRNNFGIFPSWFDYIIAISGKFGDDDALSMHRASSSPSYKNPYATPLLPPTETIEAPLSKPNFTPKPNEKIPEDQVVQSDSLEDKVDLALIHNSENILEINSIQEHNSLGLTDFILEADCVHPQDLLSKFQVAIPFEEDVVNLRFENKVESIVDGKQLLEAYDGLAIEVMVHVAGKVTVVTDDYDETIQNLIFSCIDESLIREGVNGTQNSNVDLRKSSATVIEKLCATVESMLDYKYHAVWDIAFQVVSAMFDKLGEDSAYFMRKTLKDLSDMQDIPDEGFPYRKQLHECVGSALGAMGPETFLNIVRLNLEASNLSEVKVWLFPILKQYTVGGRLSFFTEIIFRMVETMSQKAQQLKLQGLTVAFRSVDSLVYPLWVLLPSFCNYLVDTVESFADLGLILCGVLQTLAETHGIICASLNILIQQNEEVVEGKEIPTNDVSPAMLRATARYDSQYAAANLKVLRLCAPKLLDVLSRIFHESGKDDVGSLQSAIGNLASIAEKKTVNDALNTKLRDIKDGINKAARIWGISLCKANVLGIIRYMLLWNIKISMRMYGEDSWLFMMIILKVLCPNEFERESETTKQSFKGLSKLEKDQKRLSPESLGVHILYQFKERKSIEFSEFHNHLKTLLAAIEGLSQKISCGFICGDVKFHLKHRWRSRRLQTLSRLEFCVDNVLLITSHVKVSYSVWRQQSDKFVYGAVRWEKFKQVLDNCQDGSLLELLKRHEAIVDMIMVSYNNVKFFNYIKYLVKSYLVSLLKIKDALKEAKVGKFTMEQFEKSITYLILMLSSEIKYHFELHIQPVKVKILEAVTKTRAQWKEHPPDHFSVFGGHYSSLRTKMF